ncbi:MAG: hypothetical protein K2N40_00575, partial [Ureaplasma sp.]|nr:hypothetical protein [Ureaplasma sp.]
MSKYQQKLRIWLNDSIEQSISKNEYINKLFNNKIIYIKGTKELIILEYIRFQCKRYQNGKKEQFYNPSCREQSIAFKKYNINISAQWINKVINKYNNILFQLTKFKTKARFYIKLITNKLIDNNLFDFSKLNLFYLKLKNIKTFITIKSVQE